MTTSVLLPVLAVLASLSGALLIAGLVGTRARATAGRHDLDAPRDHALLRVQRKPRLIIAASICRSV